MNPKILYIFFAALSVARCSSRQAFTPDTLLEVCVGKATGSLTAIPQDSLLPRNVVPGGHEWNFVTFTDWTSGFWPGTLWYVYEYKKKEEWKRVADHFTRYLKPLSEMSAIDHDLGFQVFNSYGNGYRLTGNPEYKEVILKAADTLATLYNSNVGTILSWPRPVPNMEWPQHNTIMDNMINLELLFWAAKNGGDTSLYDLALKHAETTMKHHFRSDFTSYHVVVYDRESGEMIKGVTHQGFNDDSMWARGQAWAIYGYTMVYRETKDTKFLNFAHQVVKPYLDNLPDDLIPFWDFQAPNIPNEPKDASAAAVVASALLELASYSEGTLAQEYRAKAEHMLANLSSGNYLAPKENPAFLQHATGHFPNGSEVDCSIIYADYYFIEALTRLKRVREGKKVI